MRILCEASSADADIGSVVVLITSVWVLMLMKENIKRKMIIAPIYDFYPKYEHSNACSLGLCSERSDHCAVYG